MKPFSTFQATTNQAASLVLSALFAALAALLQSAGGWLPGFGLAISPLATAPTALAAIISIQSGVMSYLVTIGLLVILQPSELFIYPFTTGLLGLAVGLALNFASIWIAAIISGMTLFIGIITAIYALGIPILGPLHLKGISAFGLLLIFSILYSWLWVKMGYWLKKRLN